MSLIEREAGDLKRRQHREKMPPKPLIRVTQPGDIEDVVRLCAEHAVYEQAQFSPEGKADSLRSIVFASVPRLWCFVAEAGGSIVGYVTYTRDFSTWNGLSI